MSTRAGSKAHHNCSSLAFFSAPGRGDADAEDACAQENEGEGVSTAMKVDHRFALLASLVFPVGAQNPPPPFSEKVEIPPLSLAESRWVALAPVTLSSAAAVLFSREKSPPEKPTAKLVSRMPIITPKDVDPGMIKLPPTDVDYKMIVKVPDIAVVK